MFAHRERQNERSKAARPINQSISPSVHQGAPRGFGSWHAGAWRRGLEVRGLGCCLLRLGDWKAEEVGERGKCGCGYGPLICPCCEAQNHRNGPPRRDRTRDDVDDGMLLHPEVRKDEGQVCPEDDSIIWMATCSVHLKCPRPKDAAGDQHGRSPRVGPFKLTSEERLCSDRKRLADLGGCCSDLEGD